MCRSPNPTRSNGTSMMSISAAMARAKTTVNPIIFACGVTGLSQVT